MGKKKNPHLILFLFPPTNHELCIAVSSRPHATQCCFGISVDILRWRASHHDFSIAQIEGRQTVRKRQNAMVDVRIGDSAYPCAARLPLASARLLDTCLFVPGNTNSSSSSSTNGRGRLEAMTPTNAKCGPQAFSRAWPCICRLMLVQSDLDAVMAAERGNRREDWGRANFDLPSPPIVLNLLVAGV